MTPNEIKIAYGYTKSNCCNVCKNVRKTSSLNQNQVRRIKLQCSKMEEKTKGQTITVQPTYICSQFVK